MNDNDNKPQDIMSLPGPTAYYLANGAAQSAKRLPEFEHDKMYMDIFNALIPHMYKNKNLRAIGTVVMTVAFDLITTTMGLTDYDKERPDNPQGEYDADMQRFIESIMILINAMPDGITANTHLMAAKKSIFNLREKLDS